jgi:HK97 family phage major capsid protein
MDNELKTALDSLSGETKRIFADLATKHQALEKQHGDLQRQVDAIDAAGKERHVGGGFQAKTLDTMLQENEGVARLLRDRKGTAVISLKGADYAALMERKTTITSVGVGAQTTGVLQIDRIPGITPEARQTLFIRDLLVSRPTTMQIVDFVKVITPMSVASPQTEASDKAENAVSFQAASETVRTIATWIPASRQVLDDLQELAGFLDGSLRYYVNKAEEIQLLSGAGTGQNLNGLTTQATSFNTALLGSGWNKIDILGRAVEQIMNAAEITPTFAVLHPTDWWTMRLTKDSFGRYILGDPQQRGAAAQSNLFDLVPVVTTSIPVGTFLIGSGDPVAAEIRDRMEIQVEVSTEHSDSIGSFTPKCVSKNRVNSKNVPSGTTLSQAAEMRKVQRLSRKGVGNSVPEAPGTSLRLVA